MTNETSALTKTVLAVVLIAVVLVIGIYINSTIELAVDADGTAVAVVNESVTSSESAGLSATLAGGLTRNGACGTITQVLNGTVDHTNIEVANFTQTGCTVVNASTMVGWHTALLFTYPYTYSAGTAASNASGEGVTALSNGTPWLTIVVIIAFAMIVLGFLTSGFRGAGENRGQLTY